MRNVIRARRGVFKVPVEPGIDADKHFVDPFYLLTCLVAHLTKTTFSKVFIHRSDLISPIDHCNDQIQTVDMNAQVMLQSRKIASLSCPSNLLPVFPNFVAPLPRF